MVRYSRTKLQRTADRTLATLESFVVTVMDVHVVCYRLTMMTQ